MTRFPVSRLQVILLFLGLASVALWLWSIGGPDHMELRRIRPAQVLLLAAVTATCILLRFLRWQFLLRRLEVRVPTRRSVSIYLASLVGIATPAYIGELSRAVMIRHETGARLRGPVLVVLLERLLDVAALGLLGALVSGGGWRLVFTVAAVGASLLLGALAMRVARRHGISGAQLASVMQPRVLLFCLAFSLAAWVTAATAISIAAASIGLPLGILHGMRVFTSATLAGGLSMLPAGIAVTGSLAILELQSVGVSAANAVLTASVFRFGTVGITLIVACLFVIREWSLLRRKEETDAAQHFDVIAGEYLDQFSPHIWELLLGRKLGLVTQALPAPASAAGKGLDLGCGLGRQCQWLRERGYDVVGLDAAHGLLTFARSHGVDVVNGSATSLPFANASLDFVYTIGVLHHLPTRHDQHVAIREVARVLKPGGFFMVHETNPRNPLFRFYMGYVFPVLKRIDEGTERWLMPRRWQEFPQLRLIETHYFTFLPDFLPQKMLPFFLKIERWLERSPLRRYSVHYMAVMQKPAASGPPTERSALTPDRSELQQV